jgi:hypothetical protein
MREGKAYPTPFQLSMAEMIANALVIDFGGSAQLWDPGV